jgi:hypothetical protein
MNIDQSVERLQRRVVRGDDELRRADTGLLQGLLRAILESNNMRHSFEFNDQTNALTYSKFISEKEGITDSKNTNDLWSKVRYIELAVQKLLASQTMPSSAAVVTDAINAATAASGDSSGWVTKVAKFALWVQNAKSSLDPNNIKNLSDLASISKKAGQAAVWAAPYFGEFGPELAALGAAMRQFGSVVSFTDGTLKAAGLSRLTSWSKSSNEIIHHTAVELYNAGGDVRTQGLEITNKMVSSEMLRQMGMTAWLSDLSEADVDLIRYPTPEYGYFYVPLFGASYVDSEFEALLREQTQVSGRNIFDISSTVPMHAYLIMGWQKSFDPFTKVEEIFEIVVSVGDFQDEKVNPLDVLVSSKASSSQFGYSVRMRRRTNGGAWTTTQEWRVGTEPRYDLAIVAGWGELPVSSTFALCTVQQMRKYDTRAYSIYSHNCQHQAKTLINFLVNGVRPHWWNSSAAAELAICAKSEVKVGDIVVPVGGYPNTFGDSVDGTAIQVQYDTQVGASQAEIDAAVSAHTRAIIAQRTPAWETVNVVNGLIHPH